MDDKRILLRVSETKKGKSKHTYKSNTSENKDNKAEGFVIRQSTLTKYHMMRNT
jgi:hypothetical protein